MAPYPPRLARRLLDAALPPGVRGDTVRGDLLEEFRARAAASPRAAGAWYWRQALGVGLRALAGRRPDPSRPPKAGLMDALLTDARSAARALAKARGFTAASIVTLGLGIGAAAAVFSVVEAVLVRPLAFTDPARVMWLTEVGEKDQRPMSIAWPDYLDWRTRLTSFESMAAVRPTTFNLTGAESPERLTGRYVTWTFLHTLGVEPAIGRDLTPQDDVLGAAPVALISDGFWRAHFGADPGIIGRVVDLNGVPTTVVGVMPHGYRYNPLSNDAVYLPLGASATEDSGLPDRGNHDDLSAVARLKPGVTFESARAEVTAVETALEHEHPNTNTDVASQIMPVTERLANGIGPVIETLFAAVGVLLLLAAINVTSLAVARSLSRRQELAMRAALGCSRRRLVRFLLAESLVLALAGAAVGIGVAGGLIRALVAAAPPGVPRLDEVRIDGGVAVFAVAAAVIIAVIVALFPGLQASRASDQQTLVRSSRGDVGSASGQRVRRGLMVVEVALAVLLLTGAGLMARTLHALIAVDPGFDPTHLLTLRFSIDGDTSTQAARDRFQATLVTFYDRLTAELRAVPGVVDAAAAPSLPIDGANWNSVFTVVGQPLPPRANLPSSAFVPSTPDLFATLRIPLVAGRYLTPGDTATSAKVIVVNEEFVRRYLKGVEPIGQHIKQGWPEDKNDLREIVGVVHDVKLNGLESDTPAEVYLPMSQNPAASSAVVVRTTGDAAAALPSIRAVFRHLDPNLPLYDVNTMDDIVDTDLSRQHLTMMILVGFAGLALVLACVGLFGVVAHGVSARTREIGVRMALGATGRQVVGLFVGQGLLTTMAGLAIGAGGGIALARLVEAQGLLFHVSARDPAAFATAIATLLVVSLAACYVPARRASRVDPTVTLRGE